SLSANASFGPYYSWMRKKWLLLYNNIVFLTGMIRPIFQTNMHATKYGSTFFRNLSNSLRTLLTSWLTILSDFVTLIRYYNNLSWSVGRKCYKPMDTDAGIWRRICYATPPFLCCTTYLSRTVFRNPYCKTC